MADPLKAIQPFVTLSKQFKKRDPIVSYYCLLYAVQQGIEIGKGNAAAKGQLMNMMDEMQAIKREVKEEDAIKDESIGQVHVEEVAQTLFDKADAMDKASDFNKNMIKQFYFAGHLFTILNQFGEQSDEIEMKRKYAKWKAIEIDRCIKNGIPPTPGPPGGMEDEEDDEISQPQKPPAIGFNITDATPPYPGAQPVFPGQQDTPFDRPTPAPRKNIPSPSASYNPPPPPQTLSAPTPVSTSLGGGDVGSVASLSGVQKEQVQKYCKNAISCLDFDDSPGAITFLEKSLKLLKTGRES